MPHLNRSGSTSWPSSSRCRFCSCSGCLTGVSRVSDAASRCDAHGVEDCFECFDAAANSRDSSAASDSGWAHKEAQRVAEEVKTWPAWMRPQVSETKESGVNNREAGVKEPEWKPYHRSAA